MTCESESECPADMPLPAMTVRILKNCEEWRLKHASQKDFLAIIILKPKYWGLSYVYMYVCPFVTNFTYDFKQQLLHQFLS